MNTGDSGSLSTAMCDGGTRWKIGIRYVSELAINPVFISILPVFLYGLTWETLSVFIIACAVKMSGDFYLGRGFGTGAFLPVLFLIPRQGSPSASSAFVPFIDDTVIWRGNRYLIGRIRSVPLPGERNLGVALQNGGCHPGEAGLDIHETRGAYFIRVR